jgi:hypothetical protein
VRGVAARSVDFVTASDFRAGRRNGRDDFPHHLACGS